MVSTPVQQNQTLSVTYGTDGSKIASGQTTPGATNWESVGSAGIKVKVDTSAAGFTQTPLYVTSIAGNPYLWGTTGAAVVNPTPQSFEIFIRWEKGFWDNNPLEIQEANSYNWHINWIGIERSTKPTAQVVDDALNLGKGNVYFFKGNQFIRYNIAADKADAGYPKPIISGWPGLDAFANGIDAAVEWKNSTAFFFKGDQFMRFDIAADKADAGYPKPIISGWPGLDAFANGVDTAVNWGNGKIFFFKGDQFMRYDIAANKADAGYPKLITGNWSGLPF